MKLHLCILSFFMVLAVLLYGGNEQLLLKQGWKELVKDNDTAALKLFSEAYEEAKKDNNVAAMAEALLHLGIGSYGASFTNGLNYASLALAQYKKLERTEPQYALTGRSKCLQLISTIKSRQGKYSEAISLSREAMKGFAPANDSTGYLGLIYNTLGVAYAQLQLSDSSEYYHRLALEERKITGNYTYLPGSYMSVAAIEMNHGNKEQSKIHYDAAMRIADSTGNRQAQVSAWIGLGKWMLVFEKKMDHAEASFIRAKTIAQSLSDKSFYLDALEQLKELQKQQGNFKEALAYEELIRGVKDTLADWEKEQVTGSLEVQFHVAEKDRQISLVQKEKDITALTNYLLWGTIGFLIIISAGIIWFLRRINKRDKLLLLAKEELMKATEEQKRLKEQQMQNEIEFKESQLSAMTLQMLQKNELMQELKEKIEQPKDKGGDDALAKIINKGLNQDKEWTDFNTSFESINKNFYSRIKQAYPDISPNDLKICALIKMNLSIKEMAGILNISPDSVKTARYRLRKKLQLNTEDNLTDFILNLQ
jgi:DNA-binding CsgD family transcriptional regulator